MNDNQMTFISGVLCLVVSFLMAVVLHINFNQKPHLLKLFQMGFFAALLTLGVLQLGTAYINSKGGSLPGYFPPAYSTADIVFAVLGVLYYIYYIKHPPVKFK